MPGPANTGQGSRMGLRCGRPVNPEQWEWATAPSRRAGREVTMGFLDSLFRRKGADAPAEEAPAVAQECPHAAVTPRWESAADMGKTELVSAYVCEACHETFSREEGDHLVASAAERLRVSEEGRQERMGH